MTSQEPLADFEHPSVQALARRLTAGESTVEGQLARLFTYVRDQIEFRFPLQGDLVKASEVIAQGFGQCNNKSALLLALCRAVDIPARIHFSLISKDIQRGFFTGLALAAMPAHISHSWIEVQVAGRWRRIDAYINDRPLQARAVAELRRRGWKTGFSVALPRSGEPGIELDLERESFSQMAAVTDDHGTYADPIDYYGGPLYRNRPGKFKLWLYRRWIDGVNERVRCLRQGLPL